MADQATRYLRVWRGDKTGGGLADYTVAVHEGEVVLDVLHRLQATQAGDLAIRWNCKAGKCGSCSAEINGRPKLLCMTRLSVPAGGAGHDHPAAHLPGDPRPGHRRIGQLRLGAGGAVLRPAGRIEARGVPDGPGRRRPQPGVPQVHRVLAVPGRLPRDPRSRGQQGGLRRAAVLHPARRAGHAPAGRPATGVACCASVQGLGLCNITKCCTEVCPAGIKITDNAIIPMKERSADQRYDPLGRVLRSWRRREGRTPPG